MQRLKMEHHLNHQLMVSSASPVIDRQSPVINSIVSHPTAGEHSNHNSPGDGSTKGTGENAAISAIVPVPAHEATATAAAEGSRSQSVNSNASQGSNESGSKVSNGQPGHPENGNSAAQTQAPTIQSKSESMMAGPGVESQGKTSPHTHVITEAPSSRAEQLKTQHSSAAPSPILNTLVSQHPTPTMSPATSMVVAAQGSPESMTSNGSNTNTITIQELSHAQIVGNDQMSSWAHHHANQRAQIRAPYGGQRLHNSLSIDERDNDSPHQNGAMEPSSPRYYLHQQQLQQHLHHR